MPSSELTKQIAIAARRLTEGNCVAMPTETVYGLAASVHSPRGIEAIFRLKERPSFDPLIVHIDRFEQIHDLAREWPKSAESLARRFWPGPLTLVVPKLANLNPMITSGLDTVGIRMPNHIIALELIRSVNAPLAAPSANRFGRTSPTTTQHVTSEFPDAIARGEILVLEGGPCSIGVESTVCLILDNDSVSILRPGGVTKEEIESHFNGESELRHITIREPKNHQASPGHTEHHYETKKRLAVSWDEPLDRFGPSLLIDGLEVPVSNFFEIVLPDEPALAARALYAALRKGDENTASTALFIRRDTRLRINQTGLWRAIDDRISRAARLQLGFRQS